MGKWTKNLFKKLFKRKESTFTIDHSKVDNSKVLFPF